MRNDLLEQLADASDLDALGRCIHSIRDSYEVEHIVYHSVKSGGEQWGALTYAKDWVDTYTREGFQAIDPVVLSCFNRVDAVDWKRLDWSTRPARALIAEGVAHGLGNQGLSLPVRGPSGQFALFTVNHKVGDDAWRRFTKTHLNDLLLAAHFVNERAVVLDGAAEAPSSSLSPREADTLTLLAAGKSRAQAAESLKISEHTLRVYIESARHKLGAMNTTHAVANALSRGLIAL
jgi:DNA-binding CsgD family transcriptional regulator